MRRFAACPVGLVRTGTLARRRAYLVIGARWLRRVAAHHASCVRLALPHSPMEPRATRCVQRLASITTALPASPARNSALRALIRLGAGVTDFPTYAAPSVPHHAQTRHLRRCLAMMLRSVCVSVCLFGVATLTPAAGPRLYELYDMPSSRLCYYCQLHRASGTLWILYGYSTDTLQILYGYSMDILWHP